MASSAGLAPDPHLHGFTRLAPRVHYYVPPSSSTATSASTSTTSANSNTSSATLATSSDADDDADDTPAIILLCTWVGAQTRHIAKYSSAYITRYPRVPLLVVTTSLADFALRTEGWKTASLAPAVDVLLHTLSDDTGDGKAEQRRVGKRRKREVHLQLLSNGGSDTANRIAALYKKRAGGGKAAGGRLLPLRRVVLDSAPGYPHYGTSFAAITLSIPAPGWVRSLLAPAVHAYLALVYLLFVLRVLRNPVLLLRDALLNKGRWEVDGAERVYVYSKADKLVGWQDVESHADEAEARGWVVRRERFEGSAHVGHLREDEKRYWRAVLGKDYKD